MSQNNKLYSIEKPTLADIPELVQLRVQNWDVYLDIGANPEWLADEAKKVTAEMYEPRVTQAQTDKGNIAMRVARLHDAHRTIIGMIEVRRDDPEEAFSGLEVAYPSELRTLQVREGFRGYQIGRALYNVFNESNWFGDRDRYVEVAEQTPAAEIYRHWGYSEEAYRFTWGDNPAYGIGMIVLKQAGIIRPGIVAS